MTPRISIVMPCYNGELHVESSIASVLVQGFSDWELIVVDDGSTDASVERIGRFADPRIRLIRQANAGVSAARNRALAEVKSGLVAFLDADDSWEPDFLAQMYAALEAHPRAVLAYCGWQNRGLPGERGAPFIPPEYENAAKLESLLFNCRWPIHAALSRYPAVIAAGGFDPRYANAEDYVLWLNVAMRAPIVRVPQVLAIYHFHGDAQASANHAQAALQLWQAQREFLALHPQVVRQLGTHKIKRITHGELLQRGYARYWVRDLTAARALFKKAMKHGYGSWRDWKYMLPALLPLSWHEALIQRMDQTRKAASLAKD